MKKYTLTLLLALFCASASRAENAPSAALNADKVELKLRWLPGKSYLVKTTSQQKVSQTMDGKPIVIDQTTGLNFVYKVLDVDAAGAAKVEITFRDINTKIVVPGDKAPVVMEYDSTKPKTAIPPAFSGLASLAGQKVWMRLTPEGKTLEAGGFKELIDHMMKSISLPLGPERTMMENTMKGQFSEESFKEMLQKAAGSNYPTHPVGVGDSWNSDVTITQVMPMQLVSTYTLNERKDGLSIIGLESTLALNANGKPMQQEANSKTVMQMTGKQSGTLQIRESDGWVVKSRMKIDFSGTISVATTPTGPGDLARPSKKSWPISIVGTNTVESEDL